MSPLDLAGLLARRLGRYPRVKSALKWLYYGVTHALFRSPEAARCPYPLHRFAHGGQESFFGYHDKSPADPTCRWVAYHSVPADATNMRSLSPVEVVVERIDTGEARVVAHSRAWNWQLGSRLHWLDERCLIFNDVDERDGSYCARILDHSTGHELARLPHPIYDASDTGFSLTLDFTRLASLNPAYGYPALHGRWQREVPGIVRIEHASGLETPLFSMAAIRSVGKEGVGARDRDRLDHIMISPSGRRFAFLHRWEDRRASRHRLMAGLTDGSGMSILVEAPMVSHFCWHGDETLLAYARPEDGEEGWYEVGLEGGAPASLRPLWRAGLRDGHPGYLGEDLLLDQTRRSRAGMRPLWLLRSGDPRPILLGEFFSSASFHGARRCDLHPRWAPDGRRIFFDSVHEGRRQLYSLTLGDDRSDPRGRRRDGRRGRVLRDRRRRRRPSS